jgi:hypothetical protein
MITLLRDHQDGRVEPVLDIEDDRGQGLLRRVRLFLLRRHADALLRRTLRPVPIGRAEDLPPHLRRDIGLPF